MLWPQKVKKVYLTSAGPRPAASVLRFGQIYCLRCWSAEGIIYYALLQFGARHPVTIICFSWWPSSRACCQHMWQSLLLTTNFTSWFPAQLGWLDEATKVPTSTKSQDTCPWSGGTIWFKAKVRLEIYLEQSMTYYNTPSWPFTVINALMFSTTWTLASS